MWSVYVLRSLKDGCYYVGMSEDVAKRLMTHNLGKVTSTKSRRPFELILPRMCAETNLTSPMAGQKLVWHDRKRVLHWEKPIFGETKWNLISFVKKHLSLVETFKKVG
ncbi:MAG TPA: GIY-YIG nuclease family protein [Candidatus Marinimicrobia bacterium]|nr:GIY-YIG nuclease family protein [Candidatus Neomarinimicrobiota bacterium]HRS51259.1 GIY-YIG nuclease family protein [Candidatus Neomarinimicrobiota bacterium]HRU91503.1 GIY-YIG nuclease family protein [Candidatus Neomarinimicrobiota bacterium]